MSVQEDISSERRIRAAVCGMKMGLQSGYLWSGFTARKILFGHTKKENAFVERLEGTLNLQFEFILDK